MKENITATKAVNFAIRTVELYKILVEEKREYVISKQLLRSGTSIGALIKEAEHAESKADFLHKMNIALKEANKTCYWLFLLFKGVISLNHYMTNTIAILLSWLSYWRVLLKQQKQI